MNKQSLLKHDFALNKLVKLKGLAISSGNVFLQRRYSKMMTQRIIDILGPDMPWTPTDCTIIAVDFRLKKRIA